MGVGAEIRKKRKAKGLTQKYVAEKAQLDNTWLCQIEGGKKFPKEETVRKIAKVLGVPWRSLYRTEERNEVVENDESFDEYIASVLSKTSDAIVFHAEDVVYFMTSNKKLSKNELQIIIREAKKKITKEQGEDWAWEDLMDLIGSYSIFSQASHAVCDLVSDKVTVTEV